MYIPSTVCQLSMYSTVWICSEIFASSYCIFTASKYQNSTVIHLEFSLTIHRKMHLIVLIDWALENFSLQSIVRIVNTALLELDRQSRFVHSQPTITENKNKCDDIRSNAVFFKFSHSTSWEISVPYTMHIDSFCKHLDLTKDIYVAFLHWNISGFIQAKYSTWWIDEHFSKISAGINFLSPRPAS